MFYQWATWPRPRTHFLPPRFSTLLESSRRFSPVGHTIKGTEFLPVCKLLEASIGGRLPPRTRTDAWILTLRVQWTHGPPFWPVITKDQFRGQWTLRSVLFFNISTYSLRTNNKIYLWRMRTVTMHLITQPVHVLPCSNSAMKGNNGTNRMLYQDIAAKTITERPPCFTVGTRYPEL
jgi:hypothetical protein